MVEDIIFGCLLILAVGYIAKQLAPLASKDKSKIAGVEGFFALLMLVTLLVAAANIFGEAIVKFIRRILP
jgi:hypothetical protein